LIASALPSIAALGDVLRNALIFAAVFGAIVALAARLRRSMLLPLGMVLACGLLPLEIRTPCEFALQFAIALVTVAAAAVVCLWFARDNYLAYVLVVLAIVLSGPLLELFGTSIRAVQVHGWILLAALVAFWVWAVPPWRRGHPVS
jgi:hypothetical protein